MTVWLKAVSQIYLIYSINVKILPTSVFVINDGFFGGQLPIHSSAGLRRTLKQHRFHQGTVPAKQQTRTENSSSEAANKNSEQFQRSSKQGYADRPEKNSVKKMTVFIDRNKNIIHPMSYVHSLGSIYLSQMI
jgi:hypothetical protein